MFAVGIEGLFDDLDVRVFEFVYQRQERDLTSVGDGKHRTATRHFAGKSGRIIEGSHARFEDRRINHPDSPHIEELAEGPSGVVVGMLLRIVGGPKLAIEQSIRGPGIRLIHAHDNAADGKRLLAWLVSAFFRRERASGWSGEGLYLHMLALQYLEQFDLAIGVGGVGRQT